MPDKFKLNFDFASLYPSVQKVYTNAYVDAMRRKAKLDRILNKIK